MSGEREEVEAGRHLITAGPNARLDSARARGGIYIYPDVGTGLPCSGYEQDSSLDYREGTRPSRSLESRWGRVKTRTAREVLLSGRSGRI